VKKLEDKEQIMTAKLADAKASQQIMGDTLAKTKAKITELGARMDLHVSVVDHLFWVPKSRGVNMIILVLNFHCRIFKPGYREERRSLFFWPTQFTSI
jgi:hypothetical protein